MTRKKRKLLIKLLSWLLMLVVIPLVLMGILLSDSSRNNLINTSKALKNMSSSAIMSASEKLIQESSSILDRSSKDSIDLSNKTINKASGDLIKISRESLIQVSKQLSDLSRETISLTNSKVSKVSETGIKETGDQLIKLSQDSLTKAIIKANQEKAENIAQEVTLEVENARELLALFAQLSEVKKLEPKTLSSIFSSVQKKYPYLTNISITDKTGMELTRVSVEDAVYDSDLKNLSSTTEFSHAVKGKAYISDARISKRQYSYVKIAVPVPLYPGKYIGTVIADFNLSKIASNVNETKIGKTGYAFVVDNDGHVIFHPDKQLVLKKSNLASNPVVKAVRARNNSQKVFSLNNGHDVLGVGTIVKGLGWSVIVVEPTSEAFAVVQEMKKQIATSTDKTLKNIKVTSESSLAEAISNMDSSVKSASEKSEKHMSIEAQKLVDESVKIMKQKAEESARLASGKLKPIADETSALESERLQKTTDEEANKAQFGMTVSSTLMVIVFTLIAAVISVFIAKNIANPIQSITRIANRIANEDLTVDVIANDAEEEEIDELYTAFSKMKTNLKEIVSQIFGSSEQMSAASEQLTAITDQASKAIEQVSQSVQEVASGSEQQAILSENAYKLASEINEETRMVSESINSVTSLSSNAYEKAAQGSQVIGDAIQQMNLINQKVSETSKVVNVLNDKSKEINQILSMISGVTEQTDLLALNATIEAARAGTYAKGFMVIADEIRKLAEESKISTEKIGTIIGEIQKEVQLAVISMDAGIHAVNDGAKIVDNAGSTFNEIKLSVEEVNSKAKEVSDIAEKIQSGIQSMTKSVEEVSKISRDSSENTQSVAAAVQEQTASMQEIAATAQMLAKIANELVSVVSVFKI